MARLTIKLWAICILMFVNQAFCNWAQTGGPEGSCVTALAVSGNGVFAGTAPEWGGGHGVYLSTDHGASWAAVNSGLTTSYGITSLAVIANNIFAGTDGAGVFLSTNNGASWNEVNSGLTSEYSNKVGALAVMGANIFVAGPKGGGIFLSTNNGASWNEVDSGLLGEASSHLAVNGNTIYAGTMVGVFSSSNNGTSWKFIGPTTNTGVVAVTASSNTIFVATGEGLFLSTDNGTSWSHANTGLTNIYLRHSRKR